jgi:transmembrane sensor
MNNNDRHILAEWLIDKSDVNRQEALQNGFDIDNIEHHLDYIDKHSMPASDVDQSWVKFQQKLSQTSVPSEVSPSNKRYLWYALGLMLMIGSLGYLWYQKKEDVKAKEIIQEYRTDIAQVEKVQAPDFSLVTLAPKSTLHFYPHRWPQSREIWLKGRAYFEVAKGSTFDVKTDKGIVTVLGTKFEVSSYDSILNVTCVEGIVLVSADANTSKIIKAGEKISLNKMTFSEVITHNYATMAWKNKQLSFDGRSLNDVIDELSLYYPQKISIDPSLAKKRFSGVLPADNLEKALMILTKTFRIKVKKGEDNGYTLE